MQRLEVSCAVRRICTSFAAEGLNLSETNVYISYYMNNFLVYSFP